MTFREWLEENGACYDATQWVGSLSAEAAWYLCSEYAWLAWLCETVNVFDLRHPRYTAIMLRKASHNYTADGLRQVVSWEQVASRLPEELR